MYNNIFFFFLSQHSYSLSFTVHQPSKRNTDSQNKHSIPTDTVIQQKKNKRRGGETPNHHQCNPFQPFIIHHKIDQKSTENQTKPSENPTQNQAKFPMICHCCYRRICLDAAAVDLPCCCPDLLASAAGFSAMCEFWV